MSARRENKKKAIQHQNTFSFRHNPHSRKTAFISSLANTHLCPHCSSIIEWRKKFRKYKPLKEVKRCAHCGQKKIKEAYHLICDECTDKDRTGKNIICAKCLLAVDGSQGKPADDFAEEKEESDAATTNSTTLKENGFDKVTRQNVLSVSTVPNANDSQSTKTAAATRSVNSFATIAAASSASASATSASVSSSAGGPASSASVHKGEGVADSELSFEDLSSLLSSACVRERDRRTIFRAWQNRKVSDDLLKKYIRNYDPSERKAINWEEVEKMEDKPKNPDNDDDDNDDVEDDDENLEDDENFDDVDDEEN